MFFSHCLALLSLSCIYIIYPLSAFVKCFFKKTYQNFQKIFDNINPHLKSKRGQRRSADLDFLSAEKDGGVYADELDGVLHPRHHESGEAVKLDPRQPVCRYGVNDLEQV